MIQTGAIVIFVKKSGLSAQNAATGDVDGIFGGSDSTYVRDLQWKCFTPIFMSIHYIY